MVALELPLSDGQSVWDVHFSRFWFPSLLAADELGVFVSLDAFPESIEALSLRLGYNPRAVGALLPMLASLGYLVPRGGRYHLTEDARVFLLPESRFYWGGVFEGARRNNPIADKLKQVLQTPDPADPIPDPSRPGGGRTGSDGWASGDVPIEGARATARHMQSLCAPLAIGLAREGEFHATRRLLDIGGGSGCFSIALAERFPELTCTVVELPTACQVTLEYVDAAGLTGRVDTYAADMFRDRWPTDYDAVLFSNVFHDWRSDTCAMLARKAFASLPSGGTVNVHELLLDDDGSGSRSAASLAIMMVVGTQGQQFTYSQLERLLEDAGFVEIEFRTTSPLHSLVRGRKP